MRLSIRRVQGVTVDVWCGSAENFAVDKLITNPSSLYEELSAAELTDIHHVGVKLSADISEKFCETLEHSVKSWVEKYPSTPVRKRLTLITANLDSYHACSEILCQYFPE